LYFRTALNMKVYYSTDDLPVFSKAVVTIGTFDGVHLGHQQILEQLRQEAGRIGGETVIITFHPHPRKVVATNQPIYLISTIEEKIELLDKKGIDHLVVVPFTAEFSQQRPEDYIEQFLVKKFHPHTIIIGYDHRFGQGRKGDYKLLEAFSDQFGYRLLEISARVINENTVSSTLIREAVLKGDASAANALLGYDFFFEGLVVHGKKLGRGLGYPTANLQMENEEKLVPGNGIYVVEVELDGKKYGGMMSIGIRPTIGITERTIEVNIFDFDKDIYGKRLRVYVKKYLREEKKFKDLEELKEQLAVDKKDSLDFLKNN
jgi:riboflavin kinase/FMN adenylyltransferase